jgi:primase-polymerase (primpol)-like protein
MMTVVKSVSMSVQLHDKLAVAAMRNIGANFFESRFDDAGIDIITDRMREKGMQRDAMFVIHATTSTRL